MSKKYYVTIEQPCTISFEIEAETIEDAIEEAKEKYQSVSKNDLSYGTDAQIQTSSEDETESTDWDDL